MKKIILLSAVVALAFGVSLNSVNATTSQQEERGYVSASASSNKNLVPDTAEISISVITTDKRSMQKATLENKEISEKVYEAMKAMMNSANSDYVRTANFRANPIYIYSNSKKTLDKYQVSNTIIIHTKSIDKVGEMIDKAILLGATDVDNLSFSVSNYDRECQGLLTSAGKKARAQAETLVTAVGSSITGVKSLNGTCSPNASNRVMYNNMKMYSTDSLGGAVEEQVSTPIEVGVVKIFANVNASFFAK